MKMPKTPTGYLLTVYKDYTDYYFRLLKKMPRSTLYEEVGSAHLEKDYGTAKKYTTHCEGINRKYRRKGLGTLLYATMIDFALKKKWKVGSSYSPSTEARRVWKGKHLNSYFQIKKNGANTYGAMFDVVKRK
jgi:GNAT superfamily N-acetyltransferase